MSRGEIVYGAEMPLFPDDRVLARAERGHTVLNTETHSAQTNGHLNSMIINNANLDALNLGFSTAFNLGFAAVASHYKTIAMIVPSTTREQTYGWLGDTAPIREWVGPRAITKLSAHGYTIVNKKFEKTLSVERDTIEDDRYGLLRPAFEMMGRDTAIFPDEMTFGLLARGFDENCFDGQPMFDADHPVGMPGINETVSVSNVQAGSDEPWFLLDCTKPIKPMIYQERVPFRFAALDRDEDENVFMNDEFVYGVRGRMNVGFGLWQLAFASKAPLTAENYEAARIAMASFKNDAGKPLGISPTHLVCGPTLEGAAMRLLNNGTRIETVEGVPVAIQNEWAGTAKPIITPYL